MAPLDFRDVKLYVDGERVQQLFVVSLAAERFWWLAFHERRGMNALDWSDVQSVEVRSVLRIDGSGQNARRRKFARVQVALTREDSRLAYRAARAVCKLIEGKGYRILDAIVHQRAVGDLDGGEHDLKCECPDKDGLSSFEIKFRRVTTAKLLPTVRRQIQQLAWHLWPAAQAGAKENWTERVVVLLRWRSDDPNALGDWTDTYADVVSARAKDNCPEDWGPLWGWPARLPSASHVKAKKRAAAAAKAKAIAEAKARAKVKKTFDKHYAQIRRCMKYGKEMGSVSDLLSIVNSVECKKVKSTIGQKMPVWQKKWKWPARSWGQDKSCSSVTGGGREGYCAAYQALSDVYDFVR